MMFLILPSNSGRQLTVAIACAGNQGDLHDKQRIEKYPTPGTEIFI